MSLTYQDYLNDRKKKNTGAVDLSYDSFKASRDMANKKPSQIAAQELKSKEPSLIEKTKNAIGGIIQSINPRKELEKKISQVATPTFDTTQINTSIVQKNVLDQQIKSFKASEAVSSASLTPEAAAKVQKNTAPLLNGLQQLEINRTGQGTGKLDWKDKLYDVAKDPTQLVPFLSSGQDVVELGGLLTAADRLKKGTANKEDAVRLKEWLDYQNKDKSLGYNVLEVISMLPSFAGELYLTGGTATVGKKAATEGIKKLLTKEGAIQLEKLLAKEGVELTTKEAVKKLAVKTATGIAGRSLQAPVSGITRIAKGTVEKQLVSTLGVDDIKDKEPVAKSLVKSFAEQWIETVSEFGGEFTDEAASIVTKPIMSKFIKTSLFKTFQKLNPLKTMPEITKFFREVGYNGMINEMLEERMGDVGHGILNKLGLSDQEFKWPTKEQWLTEAISFAIPGLGGVAATKAFGGNKVRMTSTAARDTVELSDLKGTEAGNKILEIADEAEKKQAELEIDLGGLDGETVVTPEGNTIAVRVGEKVEPVIASETIVQEGEVVREVKNEPMVTKEEKTTSPKAVETTIKEEAVPVQPKVKSEKIIPKTEQVETVKQPKEVEEEPESKIVIEPGSRSIKNLKENLAIEEKHLEMDFYKDKDLYRARIKAIKNEMERMKAEMIIKATELGEKAFKAGKKRTPAWDKELNDLQKGLEVGEGVPIMESWLKAWDKANLAAPVEEKPESKFPEVEIEAKDIKRAGEINKAQENIKKGDRVKFTKNGENLTGTVRSMSDGSVSIDTDQIMMAGGVPIGRIVSRKKNEVELIDTEKSGKIELDETAGTQPNGNETESERVSETSKVAEEQPGNAGGSTGINSKDLARGGLGEGSNSPRIGLGKTVNEQIKDALEDITYIDRDTGEVILDRQPTDKELDLLRKYQTSGGMEKKGAEGRGLLDEYFTPKKVVNKTWNIVKSYLLGSSNLSVLEPSAGTGIFVEAAYENITNPQVTAYELTGLTAQITKALNPKATVFNLPFENVFMTSRGASKTPSQFYDVVIGNPPYGEHRGEYLGLGEEKNIKDYESYFIKRGLDLLNDNGILAMVIPSGFLRSSSSTAKEAIVKSGRIIDAYRLPNGAFANTTIGTDIIILQKSPIVEDTNTFNMRLEAEKRLQDLSKDSFFNNHPDHILGTVSKGTGNFGADEVKGSLDEANEKLEKLVSQVKPETSQPVSPQQEAVKTQTAAKVKPVKKINTSKYGWIDQQNVTDKSKIKSLTDSEGLTTLEVEAFKNSQSDGSLSTEFSGGLSEEEKLDYFSFADSKWYLDFNYVQGNIYAKLDQLELDKGRMKTEQYNKQKKALESVLPPKVTLKQTQISAISPFAKSSRIIYQDRNGASYETSIYNAFKDYIGTLDHYRDFSGLTRWDIEGYLNGYSVTGSDKERNERVRKLRVEITGNLFNNFLTLLDDFNPGNSAKVEEAFNKAFNGFYYPDYSNVPLFSNVYKVFSKTGKEFVLNKAQRNGIGFLLSKGLGGLAHDVGVGKTISDILAINEVIQRGWAKRPVVVVGENVHRQWIKEMKATLPQVTINDLGNLGGNFKGTLEALKEHGIDEGSITILTTEGFKRLGFTPETYDSLAGELSEIKEVTGDKKTKRQEEKDFEKIKTEVGRSKKKTFEGLTFEDLGFDHISFDEVHLYNKIIGSAKPPENTENGRKMANEYRSLSLEPSDQGIKAFTAAMYIQKTMGGRNVFWLSATPFTNSPLEYYSILSLTARNDLRQRGLYNVNDFIDTFLDISEGLEFTAKGTLAVKQQIRGFRNYDQFFSLLSGSIDFVDGEDAGIKRPNKIKQDHILTPSAIQVEVLDRINEELDKLSGSRDDAGKRLSLLQKTIQTTLTPYATDFYQEERPSYKEFVDNSPKIKATIEMIRQNKKDKPEANQIIYLPFIQSDRNNLDYYDLVSEYLVKELKFKPSQVASIKGGVTANERERVQREFNEGNIKVLIGSNSIVTGMNLQVRSTDLFLTMLPWNFTDLRQLSGRLWRQGNEWKNVRIHSMLLENSSDIFVSQKLANKEARYKAVSSGRRSGESGNYMETGLITFDEIKNALATDPVTAARAKSYLEGERLDKEIRGMEGQLAFLKKKFKAEELTDLEDTIERQKNNVDNYKKWAVNDDYYREQLVKEEERLQGYLEKKKKLIADREAAGIDMSQIVTVQTQLEETKVKKEELAVQAEAEMKAAKEIRATMVKKEPNYQPIIEELANQNKTFFVKEEEASKSKRSPSGMASSGGSRVGSFEKRTNSEVESHQFKLFEKVQGLIRKYAKTIGEGYTPRGASGVFYKDTTNIRVSAINDLSVAAHEIAHFLDNVYKISDVLMGVKVTTPNGNPIYDPATLKYRRAITSLYVKYYPTAKADQPLKKRVVEGFATLLQKYIESPKRITKQYHLLVNDFLKVGGRYYQPIMGEIVKDLNGIVAEYQGLSDLDKVGARVTSGELKVDKDSFLSLKDKIRTQIADALYPVEVIAKKLGLAGTASDPSLWLRAYNAVSGIINNNISTNRGYWRLRTGDIQKTLDFNWKTLVDNVYKNQIHEDFGYYLVARRQHFTFLELDKIKEEYKIAKAQLKELEESGEKPGEIIDSKTGLSLLQTIINLRNSFEQLAEILRKDGLTRAEVDGAYENNKERFASQEKMFDRLTREDLKSLKSVGLITRQQYKELVSKRGYASFKRQFYDEIVGDFNSMSGVAKVGKTKVSSLIKRKGSSRTIINPLYSGMVNHSEITRKTLKQMVYNKLANIGVSAAWPEMFQRLQLKAFKDKQTGAMIFPQERDPNIIMGRSSDGKRIPVLVDKQIKSIIDEVLTYQNIGVFEKIYIGLSRMFTAGTTGLYPQFAATNFMVDQITLQVNSTNKTKALFSPLSKLRLVITKKGGVDAEYLEEYLVMGGERQTFSGWQQLSPNELFKRVSQEKSGLEKAIGLIDKGVDIFSTPSKYSELISRAAEYIAARKAGKPVIVALEDAGRVTAPFHHVGKWGGSFGKTFIRGLPFFNATLQVLDQTARVGATKEGKKRMAGVIMVLSSAYLASMFALLKAPDDQKEQYKDLEAEDLTNFLWIPNPGGKKLIAIKMPQQFSAFGAILNMIIADMVLKTEYKPSDYMGAATAWLPDQFNITQPAKAFLAWIPQVFKPASEVIFNVKTYPKTMPLVGLVLQKGLPKNQFNENTSLFAKWLGDKFNLSPIKIDHLLTGYFGRSSGYLTGKPSAYKLTSSVLREWYFSSGRRVSNIYDLSTKMEQEYNDYQKGKTTPEDYKELYRVYMLTDDFQEAMRDYRDIDIEKNPTKAESKRQEILKIMDMIEDGRKPKGYGSWVIDAKLRRNKNLRKIKREGRLEGETSMTPNKPRLVFKFDLVKDAYAAEGLEGSNKKIVWNLDMRNNWQKFIDGISSMINFQKIDPKISKKQMDSQKRINYNAMLHLREIDPEWYYKNIGNKVEKKLLGFDMGTKEEFMKTKETVSGEASYYNPMDARQTKNNPDGIGAYGRKIESGSVAYGNRNMADRLRKGELLYIKVEGMEDIKTPYGNGIFRIDDTMNIRYDGKNNIDFFEGDLDTARKNRGRFKIKYRFVSPDLRK